MTAAALLLRTGHTGPVARCLACQAELDGGPVAYRCPACRRRVQAADLDVEYHPRSGQDGSDR